MLNSKNLHTLYNPPNFLFLSKKKITMGCMYLSQSWKNTYFGTSKVGPVQAKEAYGEVEAQPHSFLT